MSWLPRPAHPFYPWLLLVIPAVGGLLSGVLVFTLAPEAEGHGTDAVIDAYHNRQGQIRPRVPLVKIIASAITLGTGGSGGREGPIAQIGAGFGSLLGNLLRLRPAERRVLMAAGMGAGIGAIFRAPLAGTIFAAEVLYGSTEFEPEVIIPAGIASVISYCIYGLYSGWEPLFTTPADLTFTNPLRLGPYLLLALFMALLAALYTHTFYGCQRLFHRLPVRKHFRPAIGAFLTGLIALALYFLLGRNQQVLAVLAFGYSAIQDAMTQDATATAGILLGDRLGQDSHHQPDDRQRRVGRRLRAFDGDRRLRRRRVGDRAAPLVAVAGAPPGELRHRGHGRFLRRRRQDALLDADHRQRDDRRIPLAAAVAVGLHLVVHPFRQAVDLFLASGKPVPFAGPSRELRATSPGPGASEPLPHTRPGQRRRCIPAIHSPQVIDRLSGAPHSVLPVADSDNRLLGVVTLDEVYLASQAPSLQPLVLAEDLMRSDVQPLTPEDTLDRALELFVENDLLTLPVVTNLEGRKVMGMVSRFDISSAYLQHVHGPAPTGDG